MQQIIIIKIIERSVNGYIINQVGQQLMEYSFSQTFGKGGIIFQNNTTPSFQNSGNDDPKNWKKNKNCKQQCTRNQTLAECSLEQSHLTSNHRSIQRFSFSSKQFKEQNSHSWFKKVNQMYHNVKKQQIEEKIRNVDGINQRMTSLIKQIKQSQQRSRIKVADKQNKMDVNQNSQNYLNANQNNFQSNTTTPSKISVTKKQISSNTFTTSKQNIRYQPAQNISSNTRKHQQKFGIQSNRYGITNNYEQKKQQQLFWPNCRKKESIKIGQEKQNMHTAYSTQMFGSQKNRDSNNFKYAAGSTQNKYLGSSKKTNTSCQSHNISKQRQSKTKIIKQRLYQQLHRIPNKEGTNDDYLQTNTQLFYDENYSDNNKIQKGDEPDQFSQCYEQDEESNFTEKQQDQYKYQSLFEKIDNNKQSQRCQFGQSNKLLQQRNPLFYNSVSNLSQYYQKNMQINKHQVSFKKNDNGFDNRLKNIAQKIQQYQKKVQSLNINMKKTDKLKAKEYTHYKKQKENGTQFDCNNYEMGKLNTNLKQKIGNLSQNKQNNHSPYQFSSKKKQLTATWNSQGQLPTQCQQKQFKNNKFHQNSSTVLQTSKKQMLIYKNKEQIKIDLQNISSQFIKQIQLDKIFRKSKKQVAKLPQFICNNNKSKWDCLYLYYKQFVNNQNENNFKQIFCECDEQADPFLSIVIEDLADYQQIIKQCIMSYIETQAFFNKNIIHNFPRSSIQQIFSNIGRDYIKLDQFTVMISNHTKINHKCRDVYLLYHRIIACISKKKYAKICDGININQLINLLVKDCHNNEQEKTFDGDEQKNQQMLEECNGSSVKIVGELNETLKYDRKNCIIQMDHTDKKKHQGFIFKGRYR